MEGSLLFLLLTMQLVLVRFVFGHARELCIPPLNHSLVWNSVWIGGSLDLSALL